MDATETNSVVVPSLTPGCYNLLASTLLNVAVVVPSLTPGCYNKGHGHDGKNCVVVPSLTPGCYNKQPENQRLALLDAGFLAKFSV